MKEQNDGSKLIKVIKSCKTTEQLNTARKMANNFYKKYGKTGVFEMLLKKVEFNLN